jgi:hypothetical protein
MYMTNLRRLSFRLWCLLLLFAGTAFSKSAQAQCPSAIFNNSSTVALKDLTCVLPGTYNLEFVWDDGLGISSVVLTQPVVCATGNNLASDIGGGSAATGAGLLIPCGANTFPSADCLQTGSVIITLRNPITDAIIVDLAFQNGVLEPGCVVNCVTFPVTLSSFTGNVNSNGHAQLYWTTASESNASHFWVTESCDGSNFVRIAKIAAVGNSTTPQYYSYTDPTICTNRSFYRLEMVDNDCSRTFSAILRINKSGTGTAPVASNAYDPCVGAYDTKITGPDRICDNPNYAFYRLHNKPYNATVSWSVSPAGYATVIGTSARAKVKRINNYTGNITLTATFSNGTSVSKNIALGAPALSVSTSHYYSGYTMVHTATVSPLLSGTVPNDYQWYQNGIFVGTGSSWTFYVAPQATIYYEVRVNTACGLSTFYATVYNPSSGSGGGGTPCDPFAFKASPNPANGFINLRPMPCDDPPVEYKTMKKSIATVYTVRIFDKANRLRRTFSNVKIAKGASMQVNIGGLPAGNYLVEMTDGIRKATNWIIIQ